MKRIYVLFYALFLLALTGCQRPALYDMTLGSVEVFIEGGGEFPQFLVGRWKADKQGWEIVFEPDGTISEARIAMGRTRIVPGQITTLETYGGGTGGIINGSVTFSNGLANAGDYEARLFFSDSYKLEATARFGVGAVAPPSVQPSKSEVLAKFGVASTPPPSAEIDKLVYEVNEPIVVNFSNASGNYQDWIGLYEKGDANDKYIDWFYTDGTKSGEAVYIPGDWSVIYLPNDRELVVKIVMNYISVNMGINTLRGKAEYVLTGPVSEDGRIWWTTVHSFPDFEILPTDPNDLPYTSEVIFEKIAD